MRKKLDLIFAVFGFIVIIYLSSILEFNNSIYDKIIYFIVLGFILLELVDAIFNVLDLDFRNIFRYIVDIIQIIISIFIITFAILINNNIHSLYLGLIFLISSSKSIFRYRNKTETIIGTTNDNW